MIDKHLTRLLGSLMLIATITLMGFVTEAGQSKSPALHTPLASSHTYAQKKVYPPIKLPAHTKKAILQQKAWVWLKKRGVPKKQWVCLKKVIHLESRWTPNLWNSQGSDAYGLGQVKGSYKYTKNKPMKQFKVTVRYALHKYDQSFCKALQHHHKHGWY